jgi:hypothetical protein
MRSEPKTASANDDRGREFRVLTTFPKKKARHNEPHDATESCTIHCGRYLDLSMSY